MSYTIKNFVKSVLIIIVLLIILSLVINILYYFDIINNNVVKYIKMFLLILTFFIGGLYIGKNSIAKGYINGLKLSLIMVLLFFIIGLIFNNLSFSRIIYYLITITCITFGAMIGISKKES